MNIDLFDSYEFRQQPRDSNGVVVLIDVLRATSFIPVALYNGAREVVLMEDADDALSIKRDSPEVLLAGERSGEKLEGFDIGNNVALLERLAKDKRIVLSSGNFCSVVGELGVNHVVAGSLVNATAVAEYLTRSSVQEVYLVSTGTYHLDGVHHEKPQLREEDDIGALVIFHALLQHKEGVRPSTELETRYASFRSVLESPSLLKLVLRSTPYAQQLLRQDSQHDTRQNEQDMDMCFSQDVASVVPFLDHTTSYLTMRSA